MKHRYTIAHKGLGQGAHNFYFEVRDDFFACHESSGIKGGKVDVEVELERKGSMLAICMHMSGNVTTACDRCLEDCELPVDYRGRVVVKFTEDQIPFEGDVLWLSPAETVLDIEQHIYESIVLSLPYRKIHPEDVHGTPLCNPAMLDRFKIVSEDEFEQLISIKPVEDDPRWAKLKEFKKEEDPKSREENETQKI